jgi:outer membrane protein insertion porin family
LRHAAWFLVLSACVTPVAAKKEVAAAPVAPALPQVAECPKAPVAFTETGELLGAKIEKVCLVGASEDTYLGMHEFVAPREGSLLELGAVRDDLETLFQRHLLRDVVAVAQPLASKGVVLTYVVTEYESITAVDFTGVSVVRPDEFTEIAHAGMRASPYVLKRIVEAVKALYEDLGHAQAKVDFSVKSLGEGKAALTLNVDEGAQVRVTSISFEGARQLSEFELRKVVRSELAAPYRKDFAERDALALVTLYYDKGMVNAAVTSHTRPLAAPPGAVALVFDVTEGDVFRMGKLSLTGFSLGSEKDLLKQLESKPKNVFSRSAVQRDMERLRTRAQVQGHVVEITPLTTVDPVKKTIDVALEVVKKPSGQIRF